VNSEYVVWISVVIVLLIIGLLIGQKFLNPPDDAHVAQYPGPARPEQSQRVEGAFRQWFWESRSLDLAVQVGLIFVGALGIAALLPRGREANK